MDAGRLRRETGSLCHGFHGLMRVLAVAVQGFQAYFDVLILVLNIIGYGEDRCDLCAAHRLCRAVFMESILMLTQLASTQLASQ